MEIITTTQLVDQEYEEIYNRERGYLQAEREEWERLEMESINRSEQLAGKHAKVQLGKVRKRHKFEEYATVSIRKIPRFIKRTKNFQHIH